MTVNIFLQHEGPPADQEIEKAIGPVFSQFTEIRNFISETVGETHEEWKDYGKKYGWSLKTFLKKRNLFFITFYDSYFNIAFIFGERAVQAVMDSSVSDPLKQELLNARQYAEGRGLRIRVDSPGPLEDIKQLITIKTST